MNTILEKLKYRVGGWSKAQLLIELDTTILEYQIQKPYSVEAKNCLVAVSFIGGEIQKRIENESK